MKQLSPNLYSCVKFFETVIKNFYSEEQQNKNLFCFISRSSRNAPTNYSRVEKVAYVLKNLQT